MSLILDALKRAERERKEILSPFADPDPTALGPSKRRRFGGWKIAGLILLVVVAGLSAWIYSARSRTQVAKAPPAVAQAAPKVSKVRPPAPVPAPEPAPPAVIPGTEGTASLDELTRPGLAAETVPAPAAPTVKPEPEPVESSPPVPAESETPTPPPADAAKAKPQPEAATPSKKPVPPPVLTQPVPLRKFREMPPEYRADFPALNVEVHVHESDVARRFVLINGRRYKQGERLAEGPALIEIVPEGLVLEFRGEKLLYTLSR